LLKLKNKTLHFSFGFSQRLVDFLKPFFSKQKDISALAINGKRVIQKIDYLGSAQKLKRF
jgi:hypothetical protein